MADKKIVMGNQGAQTLVADRRSFLGVAALCGWGAGHEWWQPGRLAEELSVTPALTEGPFFPDRLPLDTDNDLLVINDSLTPAVGQITHLSGQIVSKSGEPIRNALIEIWQVDNTASYIHSRGHEPGKNDVNFQGYGRFLTDSTGRYYFRTIRPVPYGQGRGARAPHIHFTVSRGGKKILTSQLLIKGHEMNHRDGVMAALRDPRDRAAVVAEFQDLPNSPLKEQQVDFRIVLGQTPAEDDGHQLRSENRSSGR